MPIRSFTIFEASSPCTKNRGSEMLRRGEQRVRQTDAFVCPAIRSCITFMSVRIQCIRMRLWWRQRCSAAFCAVFTVHVCTRSSSFLDVLLDELSPQRGRALR